MCHPRRGGERPGPMGACDCGCWGSRRFLTAAEEKEMLQDYLESLRREAEGVERRLKQLEG